MNFFYRNIFVVILFILSLIKNVYSEEQNSLNSLSACADFYYSKLDILKIDQKTYENNATFEKLNSELDLIKVKKEKFEEVYRLEREKFYIQNPEPSSETYSKDEWKKKKDWEIKKIETLTPFIEKIDEVISEIGNFTKIVYKDIRIITLNYLNSKTLEMKAKDIDEYMDVFQSCEGTYNLYPLTFKLKWPQKP